MESSARRPLEGKVALITGASRGIGAAAAKRLAQGGASVVVNYLKSAGEAKRVLKAVENEHASGMVWQADVTDRSQVERMAKAVKENFGAADILVNNAFFPFEISPMLELSWKGLEEALSKELAALHNCVQAFVPGMMEKKKGKIIVVSTRLAQQPLPRMGAYAAAKAALESAANTLAIELGPSGIAVNIVTPAFTLTEASTVMPDTYKEKARMARPLQKHLYPEDIAGAIAFLASDESDMLTGSNILITGGGHLQF
ncbi:MAG TPA: SDR family oxidoreductase [Verrucomicrobiae bacterium]|jgi:3-oxoacyl-[acyl-carrier protein] reductase|nr:SDR family oxidoreductase [Verrucomicrobiae bacterium]